VKKKTLPPSRRRVPPKRFEVPRVAGAPPRVDGVIGKDEWPIGDAARTMVIAEGIRGEKVTPASQAWLVWDDKALYVAVRNPVNPKFPLQPGDVWGRDDAVEIAWRRPGGTDGNPILILRGFPSGHFESSDEAGADPAAARRAAKGVLYKARQIDDKTWEAEWRIPFGALGIEPRGNTAFPFNLSVRKTADNQWLEWQGTGGCTWKVDHAGRLRLGRRP
jgi:hypothetical protein